MGLFQAKHFVFLIALCLAVVSLTPQAQAEVTIAVVDVEMILANSKAAKSIKSQVEKKQKSFFDDVKKREDALRAEQKGIESERDSLSKEDLVKKIKAFEEKRIKAGKDIQSDKGKLDSAYSQAMNKLTKSIFEVCQQIANERKIDLVITRNNIIVGNMSLDITKDVMDQLNKSLPKLDL